MYSTSIVAEPSTPSLRAMDCHESTTGEAEFHIRALLEELGEDTSRPGLVDTPRRVWETLQYLTSGAESTAREVVGEAIFDEDYDEVVTVHDVEFYSLCEHHLLPFFGRVHLSYLPSGRIVGLSKLARMVDLCARRLQLQERLTVEIADALDDVLAPKGVGVVVEASHLCMMMRGVEKQLSETVTSAMRGVFKTDHQTRSEFLGSVSVKKFA